MDEHSIKGYHIMSPQFTPISIRTGFATNSSSSHSIIMSADGNFPAYDDYSGEYHWDWFVQQDFSAKLHYIYAAIFDQFNDVKEFAEFLDVPLDEVEKVHNSIYDPSIDHDSVGTINMDNAKMVLHSNKLAILGGNDNSGKPSWAESFSELDSNLLTYATEAYKQLMESNSDVIVLNEYSTKVVAEKDVVTVFCMHDGTKIRYSVDGVGEVYLSFPELVDIKITDYCPYGCSYCYQDSTVDGQHADSVHLKSMVDYLSSNGTFELAIGGGEPTLHPEFKQLVDYVTNKSNMVLNYTTRNLTFFKMPLGELKEHLSSIGGFAYSVDTPADIERFAKLIDYWLTLGHDELNRGKLNPKYAMENHTVVENYTQVIYDLVGKISFQVVLGSMTRDDYNALVKSLYDTYMNIKTKIGEYKESGRSWGKIIREYSGKYMYFRTQYTAPTLMLLGYKTTGRGSNSVYDYSKNAISDISYVFNTINIGIDTSAAQHLTSELEKYSIDEHTYYTKEGVASCYIDAVANTMADSSYGTMVDTHSMDTYDANTFRSTFNGYQKKAISTIPILTQ